MSTGTRERVRSAISPQELVHRPPAVDVHPPVPGRRDRRERLVEGAVHGHPRIGARGQGRAEHVHRFALVGPLGERRDDVVRGAAHDQGVDARDEVREPEVTAGPVVRPRVGVRAAGEPLDVAVEAGDEPVDAHAEEDMAGEGSVHAPHPAGPVRRITKARTPVR
jgi:hypothetical protein